MYFGWSWGGPGGSWGGPGGVPGGSWEILGSFCFFKPSWGRLGGVLGPSWGLLGAQHGPNLAPKTEPKSIKNRYKKG